MTKKLIIGITGASGIIYGIRLLETLKDRADIETHLIISKAAEQTRHYETDISAKAIATLATHTYQNQDIAAAIASGSYQTDGMIIIPCSMKTLAEIGLSTMPVDRAEAAQSYLHRR